MYIKLVLDELQRFIKHDFLIRDRVESGRKNVNGILKVILHNGYSKTI